MRIYYFSQFDGLRPTTNPISDIRFCQGLAAGGAEVELILPYTYRPSNLRSAEIRDAYDMQHPLPIHRMPTPLVKGLPTWIFVPVLILAVFAAYFLLILRHRTRLCDVTVVSRDANCLLPVVVLNRLLRKRRSTVVYWAHELRSPRRQYHRIYSRADAVIATNSAILDDLRRVYPSHQKPVALTYNPIPQEYLAREPDRQTARRVLDLPSDAGLVVYTGKLGPGLKEVDYILEAARLLPPYTFLLTGGTPSAVDHFRRHCAHRRISNVIFTGFLARVSDVRTYQRAADVLISYYTAWDHAVDYNFPQKLTEYMASGNVIVTPAFRATEGVIGPHNAIVVPPDDPGSLAAGIRTAFVEPDRAKALAAQALSDVGELTIERRSEIVVSFLRQLQRERSEQPKQAR